MNTENWRAGSFCKLRNGVSVPLLGIGTFPVNKSFTPDEYVQSIRHALQVGYRHIDSSRYYNNEDLIARAIQVSCFSSEISLARLVRRLSTTVLGKWREKRGDIHSFQGATKRDGL